MPGPDPHDDTTADYERLETDLLAQDRDAARVATADVDVLAEHHPDLLEELREVVCDDP